MRVIGEAMVSPPSITMHRPVTNEAASETRYPTRAATSSGVPCRRTDVAARSGGPGVVESESKRVNRSLGERRDLCHRPEGSTVTCEPWTPEHPLHLNPGLPCCVTES